MASAKVSGTPKAAQKKGLVRRGSVKTLLEDDRGDEIDTSNLDTSLLDKIGACPDEGTVLRRVDDWIADLESKYAGRSVRVDQ